MEKVFELFSITWEEEWKELQILCFKGRSLFSVVFYQDVEVNFHKEETVENRLGIDFLWRHFDAI